MVAMLAARRSGYDDVAAWLSARDDSELATIVYAADAGDVGVGGGSSVFDIEGVSVFAKQIPITDRELAHPHSTANLFNLPTYCQYGMHRLAGPGFGAWRELAANIVITEGVLGGEAEGFPLLYHWRVLPGRPPIASEHRDIDAVVAHFGGEPTIRTRFEELARAASSLVLFHEFIPRPAFDWLADPIEKAETVERQLFEIVAFLRSRELLHMDGHFGNMRVDDSQIYLADFGLATSPHFDLSDAERAFVAEHVDHDADYAAMRLVNWLVVAACRVPLPASGGPVDRDAYVRRCAAGDIPQDLPASVADILTRHAPAAARMNDFHWRLFAGDIHAQYLNP